jgi:hypothetical protein
VTPVFIFNQTRLIFGLPMRGAGCSAPTPQTPPRVIPRVWAMALPDARTWQARAQGVTIEPECSVGCSGRLKASAAVLVSSRDSSSAIPDVFFDSMQAAHVAQIT